MESYKTRTASDSLALRNCLLSQKMTGQWPPLRSPRGARGSIKVPGSDIKDQLDAEMSHGLLGGSESDTRGTTQEESHCALEKSLCVG